MRIMVSFSSEVCGITKLIIIVADFHSMLFLAFAIHSLITELAWKFVHERWPQLQLFRNIVKIGSCFLLILNTINETTFN